MPCFQRTATITLRASSQGFELQRSGQLGVRPEDLGKLKSTDDIIAMHSGKFARFQAAEDDVVLFFYAETPAELGPEASKALQSMLRGMALLAGERPQRKCLEVYVMGALAHQACDFPEADESVKHHISLDRFLGADGGPVPSVDADDDDEFPTEDRLFPVCTWMAATKAVSLDGHMAGSGVDLGLLHNTEVLK